MAISFQSKAFGPNTAYEVGQIQGYRRQEGWGGIV